MRDAPTNSDDVIDSRDVIARIEELQEERDGWVLGSPDGEERPNPEGWREDNPDEAEELDVLESLASEAEDYAPDWTYGATLIRESYFTEYCRELVSDIGDMPREIPSYIVIDWDGTADNLRADYTEVDFDGITYLVR